MDDVEPRLRWTAFDERCWLESKPPTGKTIVLDPTIFLEADALELGHRVSSKPDCILPLAVYELD